MGIGAHLDEASQYHDRCMSMWRDKVKRLQEERDELQAILAELRKDKS